MVDSLMLIMSKYCRVRALCTAQHLTRTALIQLLQPVLLRIVMLSLPAPQAMRIKLKVSLTAVSHLLLCVVVQHVVESQVFSVFQQTASQQILFVSW